MSPKSFSTSDSSKEEVGSSRISTLQSMSTARAMATICWIAMEQSDSCCCARAGIPRFWRIRSASSLTFFQSIIRFFPRPMYMFSATVRLGHRVISWYTVLIPKFWASLGDLIAAALSRPFR